MSGGLARSSKNISAVKLISIATEANDGLNNIQQASEEDSIKNVASKFENYKNK